MSANLLCFAGSTALRSIREKGLKPEMVKMIVGAAGGPRWLIHYHLDRAIFSSWLRKRDDPVFLLGSSIGAWRFAAACRKNPGEAIDRFLSTYTSQCYSQDPRPDEVSRVHMRMIDEILEGTGVEEVLSHPYLRLNVMAARCKWPVSSETRILLHIGLVDAALYNAVHRGGLRFLFERALFYDPRDTPPFFDMNDLPIWRIALSRQNLRYAVLASGSVPLLMAGVKNIPGGPRGTYRDGGVVDYHFDVPFLKDEEGIVFFPHHTDRIIPSWFDKKLPWRKPTRAYFENVMMVCPSPEFTRRLPLGKIPDRRDFWLFKGRDEERSTYWKKVAAEGERLADEFIDMVENEKIREHVKPFEADRF